MPDRRFMLQGLDALLKKMNAVSDEIKFKGGRFALRKAANLVASEVKKGAAVIDDPKTREQIQKNVAVRFGSKSFRRTGNLVFRVGILGGARATGREALRSARRRRGKGIASLESLGELAGKGKGNPGGDTWHWRFVEFGTRKTGARPFMRPALERNIQAATDTFIREAERAIDRAVKRGGK